MQLRMVRQTREEPSIRLATKPDADKLDADNIEKEAKEKLARVREKGQ